MQKIIKKSISQSTVDKIVRHPRKERGLISIVSTKKNGNRVIISKEIVEKLGLHDRVRVGYSENALVLSRDGNLIRKEFPLRKDRGKRIIYSKELVREIEFYLSLSFDDCTTITFYGGHEEKEEGVSYIFLYEEIGGYDEPLSNEELWKLMNERGEEEE